MPRQQTIPTFIILAYDKRQEYFKGQKNGNLLQRTQLPIL